MTASSETPFPDLAAAAAGVAALLPGVRDDALDDPTPCPDYAVREMLAHLLGLATAFRDAARKDTGPTTATAPDASKPVLDEDWRTALPERLDELAAAWRLPDAWEGMTQAGGVGLPGAVAGRVALNELVVHGWDLAVATGQPYDVDEPSLAVSREMVTPTGDDSLRDAIFGPVVPVPDGASPLDRVIGLSGRRPDWRAAHGA
ncbi:TIGR03086 family metal-binding protein [Streptomyces genisteinicus]|uniref:TIGR03086 family protein n=1 Tax=Streptomyces genisteinicus TaxID=2768068 RepID=A0A7H0I025_9ACTN|nr:TIGR03086 family metal-binding protein [Streptomyces genisteinicus]QNP66141.1 TIGR03086 family protein [Streptomyces genisteinicus]